MLRVQDLGFRAVVLSIDEGFRGSETPSLAWELGFDTVGGGGGVLRRNLTYLDSRSPAKFQEDASAKPVDPKPLNPKPKTQTIFIING